MRFKEIPRLLHLYWGKDRPLSWLRWLTVKTFALQNPDWEIIVWYPREPGIPPTWHTREHDFCTYSGENFFNRLQEAGRNVRVKKANIRDFPPMPEVMRSDLYRWRLLHEMGGFWSDFDIIYFRPMQDLKLDMTVDVLLSWGEVPDLLNWQAIGFLAGKPGNQLFQNMEALGMKLAHALEDKLKYQDLGTELLVRFAPPREKRASGSDIGQIPQHAVYPFDRVHTQMAALWEDVSILNVTRDTIGVHWFAAQRLSCEKEAQWQGFADVKKDADVGGVRWALEQCGFNVGVSNIAGEPRPWDPIKYSFIMPYYKRSQQLRSTLESFARLYPFRRDYEVIILNDAKSSMGNQEDFILNEIVNSFRNRINIKIILHGDMECWNPAPAFNEGAKFARGEYLIITNPECVHRANVLGGLDQEFEKNPDCYVMCSCFAIRQDHLMPGDKLPQGHWYHHSQHRNVGVHFCSAMSQETYERVGGFDENYSMGMGFDDDDFRNRIKRAQIPFVYRDDLVVIHLHHPNNRPADYLRRHGLNKEYYQKLWGTEALPAERLKLGPLVDFYP